MSDHEPKKASRGISTDMSPEAVSRRFAIVDELYEVWLMLRNAKKIEMPADIVRETPQQSALE